MWESGLQLLRTFLDVTDIDCREGDQAIIFGDDLPITVLSDKLDTIPYEVLTSSPESEESLSWEYLHCV